MADKPERLVDAPLKGRLMTLAHLQIYHSGKPNSHQFGPERSRLY
jgi:hypothetical protein